MKSLVLFLALSTTVAAAQSAQPAAPKSQGGAGQTAESSAPAPIGIVPPADYVIGPEDVLVVVVWREKDLTTDVMVRPDGMVSLPLLNDVQAAGFTPEQFRQRLTQAVAKYVEDPNVSVIVKAINSRKAYITGQVGKPGPYLLGGPTTVLQLIAQACGLLEYADQKNISVMRNENGKTSVLRFNYHDVARGRRTEQNIVLKPGDTVIVP